MGKAFVSDIVALVPSLASDKNGRRTVLYLLTPTSTRHFIPSALTALSASAQQARELGTSKKDPATRRKELVGYASPGLLDIVAEKGEEMVRDPGSGLLVQEIMLYAEGDKSKAIDALIAPLRAAYPAEAPDPTEELNPEEAHVLDMSHSTRTYKTILSGGHFNTSTKSVDVVDTSLSKAFATAVWEAITSEEAGGEDNVVNLAKGNAAFVLVELTQALVAAGKAAEVKRILGGKKTREEIAKSGRKGASLLAEKLGEL